LRAKREESCSWDVIVLVVVLQALIDKNRAPCLVHKVLRQRRDLLDDTMLGRSRARGVAAHPAGAGERRIPELKALPSPEDD
jgi:hypothetical protein